MMFVKERRAELGAEQPLLTLTQMAAELGRRWSLLDSAARVQYETLARDNWFFYHF